MTVYFIFFLIMSLIWLALFPYMEITYNSVSKLQKQVFCFIVAILLILLAGVRKTNMGADTTVYLQALKYYQSLPRNTILSAPLVYPYDFEPGFFLLTKIAALYSFSPTFFLFVIAALIYIPLCIFISHYSENPYISILVYFAFGFFGYSLGIFRQLIAISFSLMAFHFIHKKQLLPYIASILFASLFHTSALILLPFYFLSRLNPEKKHLFIILALEAVLLVLGRPLALFIINSLPLYAKYIGGKYDTSDTSYTMLMIYNLILIISFFIKDKEKNLQYARNALLMAIIILCLSYSITILGRAVLYYSIFLILLIPIIIDRIIVNNKLYFYGICILSLIYFFYYITKGSIIDPYRFFF